MKRVIVVLLALIIISIAGIGIFSEFRKGRENAEVNPVKLSGNQAAAGTRGLKPGLQDPAAREALGLVGADAKAEDYWRKAINNPSLPAKERSDLIEDLNEVGFADPKNLTSKDLPLILNRIAIVEKLDAMDDVNAAAIQEAHKDLVKMRDRIRP
ncbi:MAG: hypothetical protein QOF48_2484 [Verrucomicrobiota bacterium]